MNNPRAEPLAESFRIQEEASSRGFDWPNISGVFDKVHEEFREIRAAHDAGDFSHAAHELGDLLFAAVNLARFLNTRPDEELSRANEKFSRRFERLKSELELRGLRMEDCSLAELDAIWDEIKHRC